MRPYTADHIPKEDQKLFKQIRKIVEDLPDVDLGKDESGDQIILSCHILSRAIARVYHLKTVDGIYPPCCEHSWVVTENGHIIDVYPVAVIGGPILVFADARCRTPAVALYLTKGSRERYRGMFGKPSFRRSVNTISKLLRDLKKATT